MMRHNDDYSAFLKAICRNTIDPRFCTGVKVHAETEDQTVLFFYSV